MKSLHFILMCLAATSICSGQCPSNKTQLEISVSYGLLTEGRVFDGSYNDPGGNSVSRINNYNSSADFVTIRYFFFNRLAFGFSGGISGDRSKYSDPVSSTVSGTSVQESTCFAFEIYYIYLFRKYFELYTFLGTGPSFNTRVTTESTGNAAGATTTVASDKLDFQYTPLAIRVGGRLGGFLELGLGYKGVVNLGIGYKIGRSGSPWWKD